MADPTNPTGAGGPPSGGGGNPFDPGTQAHVDAMKDTLRDAQSVAGAAKMQADEAERASEAVKQTSDYMRQNFKALKKEEDAYKEMVSLVKRKLDVLKREWKDTKTAKKDLERIVALHVEALKNAKANSKEAKVMVSNLKEVRKLLKELPDAAQLSEVQLTKCDDTLKKMATNARDVAKALGELGRRGAAIRGTAGIFEAMGVGKMGTKIDRSLERVERVKQAVADSREMRETATKKHMTEKRGRAIDELKAGAKNGGLGVDPDTGRVMDLFDEKGGLTKGGRHALAGKMGFKRGTGKYSDFMAGEAEGGEAAGGEVGAGWAKAMSQGGGPIEGLTSTFENGVESLAGDFAELIPAVTVLSAGVMLLAELFDFYAKQNKEMEKNIGAGGLFTQPGVGAGSAFANAREALNPKVGLGTMLGMTFERNMGIAGALANSGQAVAPSMATGGQAANFRPGAMGEFMSGGVGEVQRIVMGAGRVGGLTDEQGVEQVIKLLGEYRETIASSENFMAKLNKDTAAAGISTTKYLKIIDGVSGAFDKMGKSLEQVTGVMRNLSRYGAVSSESLKDMMDFLEAGQQKTNMGNVATAAFTQSQMPKETLDALRETEKSTLGNYIDNLNAEAGDHGVAALNTKDIQDAMRRKDYGGAQGLANSMRKDIGNVTDPIVQHNMLDALTKVQDQINRVATVMSPDFLKRAGGAGLYKEDSAQTMANLFSNIQTASGKSGVSMKDLMEGKATGKQDIMVQQLFEMLGGKAGGFADSFQVLRNEAQNRVKDISTVQGGPKQQKENAKLMLTELFKGPQNKKAIATYLTSKGMGGLMADTSEKTFDQIMKSGKGMDTLVDLFYANLDGVAESNGTMKHLLKNNAAGDKVGADGIAAQIDQARGIAMRTQTTEDLLANTFKPLLIKLVNGIEKIVTIVGKWFGDSGGDADLGANMDAQQAKSMSDVNDAITQLNSHLDTSQAALRGFERDHMKDGKFNTASDKQQAQQMALNNSIGADTLTKLENIKQRGAFASDAEQGLVASVVKKIGAGGMPGMFGAGGYGAQQVTVNNFYSANSTMDAQQTASPATSPSSQAPTITKPGSK